MGLSNISFGLPQRAYLNAQFLTMALSSGLTCPIMNPMNEIVRKAFITGRTFMGFDPAAADFIAEYGDDDENAVVTKKVKAAAEAFHSDDPIECIKHAVEQGEKEAVVLVEGYLMLWQ